MAALTIIPNTIMSRFTDRLIAKTCLASSYDRISNSIEPPPKDLKVLLVLGSSSSPIVNNHWNVIDYLVWLVLCLFRYQWRCLPAFQKNRSILLWCKFKPVGIFLTRTYWPDRSSSLAWLWIIVLVAWNMNLLVFCLFDISRANTISKSNKYYQKKPLIGLRSKF